MSVSSSGPAALLAGFCGSDERDPLPAWQDGGVGPCFNQLVLGALPHAAMAAFSAFYLGVARRNLFQSPAPCGWTVRQVAALLAALLLAADVVLASLLRRADLYPDVLADGCGVLAWLVHFGAVTALRRSASRRTRGPPLLPLLLLLSVPNLVITLMVYCTGDRQHLNPARPLEFTRFVLAAIRPLPLLLYLLAFVFPCIGDAGHVLNINASDESPLLPESVRRPDTGEMVAEDGSGCISRLFYLWMTPLLLRGRRGELDGPADVYHLPQRLRTRVVCQHFHQCWEARRRGAAAASMGRDPWPQPVSGNLPSGAPSSRDQEDLPALESDVRLLGVLHQAFGRRYYALGALKAAASALSFAGPLLLSSLVDFMEDGAAPVGRGIRCALGLFTAALLAAVLQNVFAFEVSKVSLAARAALVSAVYGKALRASGRGLAGAGALGEVVNLMSADADRVVNFFGSFHELWSMPLRFAVTLYLLYLQVGVAFLGGLAVALLLVPLNKFLASRILSNNRRMLEHKDSRVKVTDHYY